MDGNGDAPGQAAALTRIRCPPWATVQRDAAAARPMRARKIESAISLLRHGFARERSRTWLDDHAGPALQTGSDPGIQPAAGHHSRGFYGGTARLAHINDCRKTR